MELSSFTCFHVLNCYVARRHLQVLTSFVPVSCTYCHPIIFVCEFSGCVGAFPCMMPRCGGVGIRRLEDGIEQVNVPMYVCVLVCVGGTRSSIEACCVSFRLPGPCEGSLSLG